MTKELENISKQKKNTWNFLINNMTMNDNYIFHVHTQRCNHAAKVDDEAYIKRAIQMNAASIYFSDHAPFPDDKFGNRMKYKELSGYINNLKRLQQKYPTINIYIGLEIEYLPSYKDYYYKLNEILDFLLLGQHFYEDLQNNEYKFQNNSSPIEEVIGCQRAMIDAIKTGLFSVVAHPDRIFRRYGNWDNFCDKITKELIIDDILYEKNISNYNSGLYRPEFWQNTNNIIYGSDAHDINEMFLGKTIKRKLDFY